MRDRVRRASAALLAPLLSIAASAACSQAADPFPGVKADRPLRVVVTSAAGSGVDMTTRAVTDRLSARLGRSIVVDNRAGANGVIGVNVVAGAAADGTTLLSTSNSFVINGVLKRFAYDIRQRFVPVAQLSTQYYLALVPASLPANTFKELIDYARQNPGKLTFGSAGTGSVGHLGMEIIKAKTGIDVVHVPYKGAALAGLDLAAGRIQLVFSNIAGMQMVKAGKAKVVGVMTPKRMSTFPDVPTVAESGIPGFELSNTFSWYALGKTPSVTLAGLNREVLGVLALPEIREIYAVTASEVAAQYKLGELHTMFLGEFDKWDAAVKAANIAPGSL